MQCFRPPSLGRNANHRSKYPCVSVQHSWIKESTGEAMTPRHCSKSENSRSPIDLAIIVPRGSHQRLRLFLLLHQWPPVQRHLQRMMESLHDQSLLLRLQRTTMFHHDPNLLPRLLKTTRSQLPAQWQLKHRLLCHLQHRNVVNLLPLLFDPALLTLQTL